MLNRKKAVRAGALIVLITLAILMATSAAAQNDRVEEAKTASAPLADSFVEAARGIVWDFFGVELGADTPVSSRESEWSYTLNGVRTAWTSVEFTPQDGSGLLYRVELDEQGLRRLHRAYTAEANFWGETGSPDKAAYAKKWDFEWVLGAPDVIGGMGTLIDRAGTGDRVAYDRKLGEIRTEAEAFLDAKGIAHAGIGEEEMLLANNRYEDTDTDIYFVLSFTQADGREGLIGYSLYQRDIAFLDLHTEDEIG